MNPPTTGPPRCELCGTSAAGFLGAPGFPSDLAPTVLPWCCQTRGVHMCVSGCTWVLACVCVVGV